jgi:hypothetical protein
MNTCLHPLAITSVCESETRLRRGGYRLSSDAVLIGLLFGSEDIQTSAKVPHVLHILDAVEAIYDVIQNEPVLNLPKIAERKTLWCTVYPAYQLIGWYSVGTQTEPWHTRIQQQFQDSLLFIPKPLFLFMSPSPDPFLKTLPIRIYTLETTQNQSQFVSIEFHLDARNAEKAALDQIVKAVPSQGKTSCSATHHLVQQ